MNNSSMQNRHLVDRSDAYAETYHLSVAACRQRLLSGRPHVSEDPNEDLSGQFDPFFFLLFLHPEVKLS